MNIPKQLIRVSLISLLLLATGCTTLKQTDDTASQISTDPLEPINRSIYKFNNVVDKIALKPAAQAYNYAVPKPAKKSVGNFFGNLAEPLNIINNLLQGKVDGSLQSTFRFAVNSTVGILGLFDVAKHYEVEAVPEDFGQTLAAWGVKPGPYIMLPLLGPSNLRDSFGRVTSAAIYYPNSAVTSSTGAALGLTIVEAIDTRASLLGADAVLESQLDPYLFLKSAYDNNRINVIYDGNPPTPSEDELDF